jgi:Flp pilus assembly pilin Flp
MRKIVFRFANAQSGATAVEYALMAMCIVVAIVVSVAFTGAQLNNTYSEISGIFN